MSKTDKGGSFERSESRYLSLWWTDNDRDDVIWRNRNRRTKEAFNAQQQCGDLQACHTLALALFEVFNFELKDGYSKKKTDSTKKKIAKGKAVRPQRVRNTPWDLLEVVDGQATDDGLVILNFWKQCLSDAELSRRIPLLIFKRDFHDPVVVVNPDNFAFFIDQSGPMPTRYLSLIDRDQGLRLYFYRQDDFFEWLRPDIVRLYHLGGGKNV